MAERIQPKLARVRPPRVQISYDIQVGDAIEIRQLPFVVAVLANLVGQPAGPSPHLSDRKFVEIDRDNFNAVMASINPRLEFFVESRLTDDVQRIAIEIEFRHLDDFEPTQVANQVPTLRKLLLKRQQLSTLLAKMDGNVRLTDWLRRISASNGMMQQILAEASEQDAEWSRKINPETQLRTQTTESTKAISALVTQPARSLVETVIIDARLSRDEELRHRFHSEITTLVEEVTNSTLQVSADLEASINARLAEIDDFLSLQVNPIMHDVEFQRLEASWRGLYYLVCQTETSTMMKIRVLNLSKSELLRDLEKSIEFDQSVFFKRVYEEEYGTFGGTPYGAIIGDYEFGPSPHDLSFLEKISSIAATTHAPFIAAASPALFGLDSFTDLTAPRDLAKIFDTVEYSKWNNFRASEDSRFVGLTLPRILMRPPYGSNAIPVEAFNFKEDADGHNKYLWGNTAYAFGTCLTNAFAKFFWCAAIRGVEGGGLVQDLPVTTVMSDDGEVVVKCPTEIAITDRREKELSDLGFIPIVHAKGTDYAAFFSAQSCQKPSLYDRELANANARLSTQLQCVFTTSRFAHYLKAMIRDKSVSFMSRGDCERFLNQWISKYVLADDDASPAARAQYPLREARIDVTEIEGKPGVYKAVMFIRPHFQIDELSVSLRLVVELPNQPWH